MAFSMSFLKALIYMVMKDLEKIMEVSFYGPLCMKFLYFTILVSSKDDGESVHMHRLARALAAPIAQGMDDNEGSDQTLDLKLWRYLCTEILCIRP